MKNSEITSLIIVGTILILCIISFMICLIVLVNKLKQENKNTEKEYMNLYEQKEFIVKKRKEELAKNVILEQELIHLKHTNKIEYDELKDKYTYNKQIYLKHQKELQEKIESLTSELETEKSLNEKHLETIDTLKLKNNINNEEFYLCLLRTYKNFTRVDFPIDRRTKAFKEFILTKEAIEYIITLLLRKESISIHLKENLIRMLSKERIKNTEIGNYDLIVENNKIIFKNRLK